MTIDYSTYERQILSKCWNHRIYMRVEEMVIGKSYRCFARNFSVGKWNGKGFDYIRQKFNLTFPDVEYHYDTNDNYGTVRPLWEVTDVD